MFDLDKKMQGCTYEKFYMKIYLKNKYQLMHYYYFLMIFFKKKNHAKSTTWPNQATACEHAFIF
jgi:hypothetical protein